MLYFSAKTQMCLSLIHICSSATMIFIFLHSHAFLSIFSRFRPFLFIKCLPPLFWRIRDMISVSYTHLDVYKRQAQNKKIDEFIKKYDANQTAGKIEENIILMRSALTEFPNNLLLMSRSAHAFFSAPGKYIWMNAFCSAKKY